MTAMSELPKHQNNIGSILVKAKII